MLPLIGVILAGVLVGVLVVVIRRRKANENPTPGMTWRAGCGGDPGVTD